MIYFVDEDETQINPFRVELILRGFKTTIIEDADKAYNFFKTANNEILDLVIIDVMLRVNVNSEVSRYSYANTNGYTTTGIRLLEDLCEIRKDIFPDKSILFSMANTVELVRRIKDVGKLFSIEYLFKSQFATPFDFGEKIEEIIKKRRG